jgi:hypothetical protein
MGVALIPPQRRRGRRERWRLGERQTAKRNGLHRRDAEDAEKDGNGVTADGDGHPQMTQMAQMGIEGTENPETGEKDCDEPERGAPRGRRKGWRGRWRVGFCVLISAFCIASPVPRWNQPQASRLGPAVEACPLFPCPLFPHVPSELHERPHLISQFLSARCPGPR